MWGKCLGYGPDQNAKSRTAPAYQGVDKKANIIAGERLHHQSVQIKTFGQINMYY